jgi:hypothetical protein
MNNPRPEYSSTELEFAILEYFEYNSTVGRDHGMKMKGRRDEGTTTTTTRRVAQRVYSGHTKSLVCPHL